MHAFPGDNLNVEKLSSDGNPKVAQTGEVFVPGAIVIANLSNPREKFWGMILANHEGQWMIKIGTAGSKDANGIVDLGNGLCFRRQAA